MKESILPNWISVLTAAIMIGLFSACHAPKNDFETWSVYRGDGGTNAYSRLNQINTENVAELATAWTYRTGDATENSSMECNPIIVRDILYGISPKLKTFALNAKTGEPLWIFNPFDENSKEGGINRGLTYWEDKDEQRIFMFVSNKMIALNARTGKQIMNFGDSGYVDLNKGLRHVNGTERQESVGNTSPGVIFKDLIIIGSAVGENYESSPGHIRAYDVRTGKQKWIFHTIPEPGELGYDTWPKEGNQMAGGCNAWSGLSIDSKRGIVFAGTGSPAFDFHGGERIGQNLFGNCVLALDAATGKLIWYYQLTHHDIWDYDLPAPPNLVTVKMDGRSVDAVAQITKQGYVFVFDRETGKPLLPIEEVPVPKSEFPAEQNWPTQPVPVMPRPLARQNFDESIITELSPEAHDFVLNEAKQYRWGEIYLPPHPDGTIEIPGMRGGAEWSGACVDMETGMMYVGINERPTVVQLLDREEDIHALWQNQPMIKVGKILYQKNCEVCHGADKKGNNSFPSLANIKGRLTPDDVKRLLQGSRGIMPSFKALPDVDKDAINAFLFDRNESGIYKMEGKGGNSTDQASSKKRYRLKGYNYLVDQNGYPGIKPPWGTLNAVNLNSGEVTWTIPLGEYPELSARGIPPTGTQLFGGGIVTAGGLIFIGASHDEKFRAIDKSTGEILWEVKLPGGGYATPSTYEVDGKQYVVIAAGGGGRQGTLATDYYVAFALPE